MSKAETKATGRLRGLHPPQPGADVRGQSQRNTIQEREYRKVIDKMLEKESSGKKFQLQLCHIRGGHAQKLLKNRTTFGVNSLDDVAVDLGIKRLSLQQCIKFYKRVSKPTLAELCALKRPPSWRMMAKWVGIKEEAKRAKILKDILSGNIGPDGFEEHLRRLLGRGPKKPRRPVSVSAAFRKIGAEAFTMVQHLDWVPGAAKDLGKIEDAVRRRETKTIVRDSLKQMKAAFDKLKYAIADCEKLV